MSVVGQFMQDPRVAHWQAVKRILRNLKGTPTRGLFNKKYDRALDVNCYVDSDWVSSIYDGCSTSGYCVTLGGNIVIRKSKK